MTELDVLIEAEATRERELPGYACACVGPAPGHRLCSCQESFLQSLLNSLHAAGYVIAPKEPNAEAILAGARALVDRVYLKGDAWDRCVEEDRREEWLNGMRFGYCAVIGINS